jgi:hypothetical protein
MWILMQPDGVDEEQELIDDLWEVERWMPRKK